MNRVLDLICPECGQTFTGTFERRGADASIDDIDDDLLNDPTIHIEELDDGYRIYEHGVVQ